MATSGSAAASASAVTTVPGEPSTTARLPSGRTVGSLLGVTVRLIARATDRGTVSPSVTATVTVVVAALLPSSAFAAVNTSWLTQVSAPPGVPT